MSTKSFYGIGQGSFYGGGTYGNGQLPVGFIEKTIGPASIISFNDGVKNKPLKECVIGIEPVQSGTGDPSPDNVRPISGWTGANIYVSPTYDPADGRTYSVAFPTEAGTVYGGTLDVTSGVLTVDRHGMVFDGTEVWISAGSQTSRLFRYIDNRGRAILTGRKASSHFVNNSVTTTTSGIGYYAYTSSGKTSSYIQFRPDLNDIPNVAEWKEWLVEQALAGTPLMCYWTTLDVITYQLTPVEITTLLGENNVWADTGDIEKLTYLIKK